MTDTQPMDPRLVEAEVKKAEVEARQIEQEMALEQAKADSEAKLREAEIRKTLAEAEMEEAKAATYQINLERERRKEADELAADKHNYVYQFRAEVSHNSVNACVEALTKWERQADGPITVEIVLHSPGGSIFDGFALIDFITMMRRRGHTVNTTALGMAASMAGVILQAGDKRSIGKNAFCLIHQAQFGAAGSYGEIEDRVKLVEMMQDKILDLFAARSNLTKAQLKRRWTRKDWWLSAEEALKHGFVDEVI